MRMCLRTKTTTPGRWTCLAIRTCAAGLLLAEAAWSFEDPDVRKPASSEAARTPSPAEVRLKEDVNYLAADERDGRGPGTRGIDEAADYISFVFKSAGLKPAHGADGYFQAFSIGGSPSLGRSQELAFHGPADKRLEGQFKTDFTPMAIGTSEKLKDLPIVFAGYGITARDEARKLDYDDYAGIDVKGKAVLIIRREPQEDDEKSPFDGRRSSRFATFQHKMTNAYQHGAAAVLLVNDGHTVKGIKDELLRFDAPGTQPFSRIPFVMLTRDFADKLLAAGAYPSLSDHEERIDSELKPKSHELRGWTLSGQVTIDRDDLKTKNVVGVLEGAGPHADETVVIGAHYDHLGHGGLFSGSLAPLSREIHNGADDNASGTATVLELARRLGARRDAPPRRIVFIAFSGEERGLLGSHYYVEHPLFPLSSTVMMFNLDMVGRLNDKDELTMIGTGTSSGFEELVDVLGKSAGLKIKKIAGMTDGFGGSDHQSFYPRGIPVLFAFTGVHRDYHRPTDDSNKINFAGMSRIADYLELLVLDVVRRPERPAYIRIAERRGRSADPARMGSSVYMGTMPDYEEASKEKAEGMKIQGVSEGSPAEKAGLKGGDVIVRLGDKKIGTIYDYMEALGAYKPGDEVDVVAKRDGKEVKLRVKLGSRPGH
jgi:Peptidase family M28/PDZ domain/PA domain